MSKINININKELPPLARPTLSFAPSPHSQKKYSLLSQPPPLQKKLGKCGTIELELVPKSADLDRILVPFLQRNWDRILVPF